MSVPADEEVRADAPPPEEPKPPPADRPSDERAGPKAVPALELARPIAIVGLVAVIYGRSLGPSFAGLSVGMNKLVDATKDAASVVSQLFAMMGIATTLALVIALLASRAPGWVRGLGAGLAGLILLLDFAAAVTRVSPAAQLALGFGAASMALALGAHALRFPVARNAALVILAGGAGGLARLGAVLLATGGERFVTSSRGLATLAMLLQLASIGVALTAVAARRGKLTSPTTMVVLVLAFLVTRAALAGGADEAGFASVLAHRFIDRSAWHPDALLPPALRAFTAVLAPLAAIAAATARKSIPAFSAAVALALLVGPACEVPLGALSLAMASLLVVVGSHDARGMWAALTAS